MAQNSVHSQTHFLAALCCALITSISAADTPPPPPPPAMPNFGAASGPETPAAAAHREAAKQAAGNQWDNAYRFLCKVGAQQQGMPDESAIEPQWIFDNVAVLGDRMTVMFALKTSAGIMLIDSGYSTKIESVLLPSLTKLGIDPASVKYILVTHGHPDHFGAAPYFQAHYNTHVVASAADWELMSKPPTLLPPNPQPWMVATGPMRDIVVGDGDEIVLGDMHVSAYLIPGHTPGSLGFIFPVKDAGKSRTAAIFGGTILDTRLIANEGLQQYVQSLAHFGAVTHKRKVEVELQNHPMFDDMWVKVAALSARKQGQPNPFVVGDAAYQNFLKVMSECDQAALAQRQ